jgi:parvulin-like peptidyl-prolyl isomerase
MATEIEAAAMKLKTGEISEPIKTKSGYEIIKITDKKLGPVFEFDKVKNFIQQRLSAEKQKEAFDSYIDELKKSLKVEMNKDAIAKLASEETKEAPKPAAKEAPVKKK